MGEGTCTEAEMGGGGCVTEGGDEKGAMISGVGSINVGGAGRGFVRSYARH
jgi:hypothetical protein